MPPHSPTIKLEIPHDITCVIILTSKAYKSMQTDLMLNNCYTLLDHSFLFYHFMVQTMNVSVTFSA